MPDGYRRCVESWAPLHPDWKIEFWDMERLLSLDDILNRWVAKLDHPTMQSNLMRLEVVRKFGGVYLDCDIECLKPIDQLFSSAEAVISMRNRSWLDNCIIAAVPGSPWLTEVCRALFVRRATIHYILDIDGQYRLVTDRHPEVVRLPREVMNVSMHASDDKARKTAYAIHHHISLWKTMDDRYVRKYGSPAERSA